MKRMKRTFHPVGHGAFYTEEFINGKTVVYDCGSLSGISFIKSVIKKTFKKGHVIDAVFISHLHDDHINGLDFLLKHCHVKKLFLPLITDIYEKIEVMINLSSYFGSQNIYNALVNEDDDIFEATTIVRVPVTEENVDLTIDNIIDDTTSETLLKSPVIRIDKDFNWVYIPFNYRFDELSKIIKAFLIQSGISISPEKLVKEWQKSGVPYQIKKQYERIHGKFYNVNSMTLYSGFKSSEVNSFFEIKLFNKSRCIYFNDICGCLYFGDYEASGKNKWKKFINHYNNYWGYVGIVQIPHHGSKHNYNVEINRINPKVSVISAKKSKNIFHHPHASVLKLIVQDGGIPIHVSDNPKSIFTQFIYVI